MENVQMLIPMKPKALWQQMKEIVEQVVKESNLQTPDKHSERPLLKVKEVCGIFHISKPTIYEWSK